MGTVLACATEGRVYNDNSPQIRKWLGEVVDKEGETLHRHGRWLPMMCPRPVLPKEARNESIPGFHRGRPGFLSTRHRKPLRSFAARPARAQRAGG